jgi:hypothetical protein
VVVLVAGVRAGGSGSIDTTGAVLAPGDAPVPGDVLTEEGADLGAPPTIDTWYGQFPGNYPAGFESVSDRVDAGLGGPDFHAQVDMTLPGGVYDFGGFFVDHGVTVTFDGPSTVRVAKDATVEGRVEMTGAARGDRLTFRCAGDLRVTAHGGSSTGFAADDDGASLVLDVLGDLTVTADDGAEPTFTAAGEGGRLDILAMNPTQVPTHVDFERTRFTAGNVVSIDARWSPVVLDDCDADGRLSVMCREAIRYDCPDDGDCTDGDADEDAMVIRGGTYAGGLSVYAQSGDISLVDGVVVKGGRCDLYATGFGGGVVSGNLRLAPDTVIEVTDHVTLAALETLEIGDRSSVRTTTGGDRAWLFVGAHHEVRIGDGAVVEHAGGRGPSVGQIHDSLAITGETVRVRGTVRGAGPELYVGANADVLLQGDAVIDGGDGAVVVGAHGAVVAEGGKVVVTGGDVDIRCATGDLDLDLDHLAASEGKIAALANGRVRLRGTYAAARDIQVISLADVVSVAGATLTTDDVSDGLSGFVRLATYGSPTTVIIGGDLPADGDDGDDDGDDDDVDAKAATGAADEARTLINAAGATLRTGGSDAQSGSILLQNQEGSGKVAKASIRVVRAAAQRRGGEVLTRIRGTIAVPRRRIELQGSGRVAAGTVDERVLLSGGRQSLSGEGSAVRLRLTRAASTRIAFAIDVTEPAAVQGQTASVGFHRAGLHVRGSFRRPRTR